MGKIQFRATIPQVMSALRFGGDAPRIMFEVPKSDAELAVGLIALQGVGLKITVEIDDGKETEKEQSAGSATAKGRRPWLERKRDAKADG